MEHSSFLIKLLLLLLFNVHLSQGIKHSLQYFYTGITPGTQFPEFTAVGLVDEEEIVYYDSSSRNAILKSEWMKYNEAAVAKYWERETVIWKEEEGWLKTDVAALKKRFNHTKDVYTVQIMFGCELNDDGTATAYSQLGNNGDDFIYLDLNSKIWTLVKPQPVITENKWDPTGHDAGYCTDYLKTECIEMLKTFVSYSRKTLERKDRPEVSVFQTHSPSPAVVCHTTGFFPKTLSIFWQKDGEDVNEDVEYRETLPNPDGSFQKRIILTVSAEELQKHTYTCVVQHSSLEKDLVVGVPKDGGSDGGQIGIIVGVVVALVVLVAVVVGIVVWKKKTSGFRRVPPKPSSERDSSSIIS